MTADTVTLLRAVDGAVLTKRIRQETDGEWVVDGYDRAFEFAVQECPVTGLIDLGQLIASLERFPSVCVIRGRPLPGIDRKRCRRLIYPIVDDAGREIDPTFEAAPRRWIALDFDALPTPGWNADDLVRRRAATLRDRAEQHVPTTWPDDPAELVDPDLAGDLDPAPIDPVRDWPLVVHAAVSTLPPEFHNASAWWAMTSSAGIKPGTRLRLWYWLNRPVSDAECKRWLADAPVDRSLYSPVQVTYTAAPIFDPPELDPVPLRAGWWWRHKNTVAVPELPEPPAPAPVQVAAPPRTRIEGGHREIASGCLARADLTDWEREFCAKIARLEHLTEKQAETLARIANPAAAKAKAYAAAALRGIETATAGGRHQTLMSVGVRLYSLADAGLLDHAEVTKQLLGSALVPLNVAERRERGMSHVGRRSKNEEAVDWARARARAAPDIPEGFRS